MSPSETYDRDGYCVVRGLLPVEACNAFLNQLKGDIERSGRGIETLRQAGPLLAREAVELYGFHYPPILGLLWGLTASVAAATGRDLLPTYAYFRIYREGDVCRVHSDRYACEHSASLTLDYSDGEVWPLEIAADRCVPENRVEADFAGDRYSAVRLTPGDALLYQGVHHRHGRITPNPNGWSAHLFLHWVERGGAHAEHAFDGRAELVRPANFTFA